jgi:hypothetical protein
VVTVLVCSAATLIYASHLYLFHTLRGSGTSFLFQLAEAGLHLGIWALLTPLVMGLATAKPLFGAPRARRLALQLASGLLVALFQVVIHAALDHWLLHDLERGLPGLGDRVIHLFTRTYYANVLVYMGLVAAFGLHAARRNRGRRGIPGSVAAAEEGNRDDRGSAGTAQTATLGYLDFVTVESEGRIRLLALREIECFVSAGNYIEVSTGGTSHRVRGTLAGIEARVDPRRFFRAHRSAIVNLAFVAEIRSLHGDHNEIVLRTGRRLPLSRRYRDRLPQLL